MILPEDAKKSIQNAIKLLQEVMAKYSQAYPPGAEPPVVTPPVTSPPKPEPPKPVGENFAIPVPAEFTKRHPGKKLNWIRKIGYSDVKAPADYPFAELHFSSDPANARVSKDAIDIAGSINGAVGSYEILRPTQQTVLYGVKGAKNPAPGASGWSATYKRGTHVLIAKRNPQPGGKYGPWRTIDINNTTENSVMGRSGTRTEIEFALPKEHMLPGNPKYSMMGKEYIYAVRWKLSEDSQLTKKGKVAQDIYSSIFNFKQDYYPKSGQNFERNGNFALRLEGDAINVRIRANKTPNQNKSNIDVVERLPDRKLTDRKFHNIFLHVKWSAGDDGFINLYEGDTLWYSHKGANCFADTVGGLGPYNKLGMYDNFWTNNKENGSDFQRALHDYYGVAVIQ